MARLPRLVAVEMTAPDDARAEALREYCYDEVCGNSDQCGYHEAFNQGIDKALAALAPRPVQAEAGLVNLAHNQLRDLVTALRTQLEDADDRERDLHGRREVAEAETHAITRERDTLQAQLATVREMHETVTAQVAAMTRERGLMETRAVEAENGEEAAEARVARLEAALERSLRQVHNCLLVLPGSAFKREVEEWLIVALRFSGPGGEREGTDG